MAAGAQFVKHFHQRDFGAVELPVAGEDAAVFIAVRVAQHDVLLAPAALHQRGHALQCVKRAHDGRGIAQVFDGFKQRHHDQIAHRVQVQGAAQQAGLFLQQQNFQQIAHAFGVADDVVADGLCAKAFAHDPRHRKNRLFGLGMRRIGCALHLQRTRVLQQA